MRPSMAVVMGQLIDVCCIFMSRCLLDTERTISFSVDIFSR